MAEMVIPPPPGGAEIRKGYADGAQLAREVEKRRVSGHLRDFVSGKGFHSTYIKTPSLLRMKPLTPATFFFEATIQPVAQRPQTEGNRPLPANAYVRGHGGLQPPAFHRGTRLEKGRSRSSAFRGPEGSPRQDMSYLHVGAFYLRAKTGMI